MFEDLLEEHHGVPHYKEYFEYNNMQVGKPFCLRTAISLHGKEIIPDEKGLYHLFYKGRLVYIGMSKRLRGRLLYHLNDIDMVFDAILWFKTPNLSVEEILDRETKLIKTFKPPLNTIGLCSR